MTCPPLDRWDALSMGLLSNSDSAQLMTHANTCHKCAERLADAQRVHAELSQNYASLKEQHSQQREQLMSAIANESMQSHQNKTWRLGDMRMSKPIKKTIAWTLLPAACIAIAIFAAMFGSPDPAFAKTIEKLNRASSMICTITVNKDAALELMSTTTGADVEALKNVDIALPTMKFYLDDKSSTWCINIDIGKNAQNKIIHKEGKLHAVSNGRYYGPTLPNSTVNSPYSDESVEFILALKSHNAMNAKPIGERTIDGRLTIGFELEAGTVNLDESKTYPNPARLWVDPNTHLPVEIELLFDFSKSSQNDDNNKKESHATPLLVLKDFQWDKDIDPSVFALPPTEPTESIKRMELIQTLAGVEQAYAAYAHEMLDSSGNFRNVAALPSDREKYKKLIFEELGKLGMNVDNLAEALTTDLPTLGKAMITAYKRCMADEAAPARTD